ncbi:hypothetical protein ACWDZ8_34090, partial [Streptomyces sp. NPDC003233]
MPAFSLDPRQTAWCAELRTTAAERLRPLADKGEPGHVNRPLLAELGQLGLFLSAACCGVRANTRWTKMPGRCTASG